LEGNSLINKFLYLLLTVSEFGQYISGMFAMNWRRQSSRRILIDSRRSPARWKNGLNGKAGTAPALIFVPA
jgi:hypothetical protein